MNINFLNTKIFSSLVASICCCAQPQEVTLQKVHDKVLETILRADQVPGLASEEFKALKSGIIAKLNALNLNGELVIQGTDKEVRPYFVALQGIIEHVLANELNKSIFHLKGVIHTPMPATPLCTDGDVSSELVDASLANDPLRAFTVKARATILRDYLFQGGDLYVAYPKEGFNKRNAKQQQVYRDVLQRFPAHLFDRPLNLEAIDSELIGATYFFTGKDGIRYIFAIKMTQANNPMDEGHFGLWLGRADEPAIAERVSAISKVLDFNP